MPLRKLFEMGIYGMFDCYMQQSFFNIVLIYRLFILSFRFNEAVLVNIYCKDKFVQEGKKDWFYILIFCVIELFFDY